MPDKELVVLVSVAGWPDATGTPGLLITPRLVIVPRPPRALLAPAQELQALLVLTPLDEPPLDDAPVVERIRAVALYSYPEPQLGVATLPLDAKLPSSILLVLERASANPPVPMGDKPPDSDLAASGEDPWLALVRLRVIPDRNPPGPSVELLRDLPEVERRQRATPWNPGGSLDEWRPWWPFRIW